MKLLKSGIFILLFAIFVVFPSCKGQQNKEVSQSKNDALSIGKVVEKLHNQIWDIYQDRKGNYWFGSNGKGVYHYDGKILKLITTADGLIDNSIRGIQEDLSGNIFIETPEGVSKFDGKKFITLQAITSSKNKWQLKPTDLWFNCNASLNHVYRYDGKNLYELALPKKDLTKLFDNNKKALSYSPYAVFGINKDKNGHIWFGTILAGAFRYDGKSFVWIGEKELSRRADGREPGVRSMLEDKDGNMWLSNFKSRYKINLEHPKQYEKLVGVDPNVLLKEDIIGFNAGLTDKNGHLWVVSFGDNVWHYDGKTLSRFPIDDEVDVLLISIYQDNQGTIWLGTNNAGVYRQNEKTFEKFEVKK